MYKVELGLDTFGDVTVDDDGSVLPQPRVIRNVVDEAVFADQLGVDFIGVGEHHRPDLAISAPEVALAAIASRTKHIRLGSAVTVLSTDDPVRVYERFATLDAVSDGRTEIILGRGSFTESFSLFGYRLDDYDVLFEEKLQLFAELLKEGPVMWSGTTRPPLTGQRAYPTTESGSLRAWSALAAAPSRLCARHDTVFRSCWRSSAARLEGSRHTSSSTTKRSPSSDIPIAQSPFTRPGTSQSRTSRRARSCGRTTRHFTRALAANAGGRP